MIDQDIDQKLQHTLDTCAAYGATISAQIASASSSSCSSNTASLREEFFLRNNACCHLHPHQVEGVRWLLALFTCGVNGILADDMGLGKTVQVIAFLSALYGQRYLGTHLIVVPLSTLDNWKKELHRWCPWLPVVVYHGTREERHGLRTWIRRRYQKAWESESTLAERARRGEPIEELVQEVGGVVITTYEMVMTDNAALCKLIPWDMLIVDEAHRLKNFNGKLLEKLRKCNAEGRLLLTGTPLQNTIRELWSILNFIMPEIFDDRSDFQAWFDQAESAQQSQQQQPLQPEPHNNPSDVERNDHVVEVLPTAMTTLSQRPPPETTTSSNRRGGGGGVAVRTMRQYFALDGDDEKMTTQQEVTAVKAASSAPPLVTCCPAEVTSEAVSKTVASIHTALKPFILRRVKRDIESLNIPKKYEVVIDTPLCLAQRDMYRLVSSEDRYANNKMMHQRKVCCHPFLFPEGLPKPSPSSPTATRTVMKWTIEECCRLIDDGLLTPNVAKDQLNVLLKHSTKFAALDIMLRQLLKKKSSSGEGSPPQHKVLIFSQMTKVLDLIEVYFLLLDRSISSGSGGGEEVAFRVPFVRLDGSMALEERTESIRRFNSRGGGGGGGGGDLNRKRFRQEEPSSTQDNNSSDSDLEIFATPQKEETKSSRSVGTTTPPPDQSARQNNNTSSSTSSINDSEDEAPLVFLISTKSGGVGLNLIAADTVILFDSDFNPHNDQQAIDRCHRIGQTRPVVVYRLVSPGTVEETLMSIALRKKKLEQMVLAAGMFSSLGEDKKEDQSVSSKLDDGSKAELTPTLLLLDPPPPFEGNPMAQWQSEVLTLMDREAVMTKLFAVQ